MDGPLALAFIEQLRDWQDFEPAKQFCPEMVKDVLLAADEIERLRLLVGVQQTGVARFKQDADDYKADTFRLHAETMVLFDALLEMKCRDDRNGSLPPAYREIIDKALAALPAQSGSGVKSEAYDFEVEAKAHLSRWGCNDMTNAGMVNMVAAAMRSGAAISGSVAQCREDVARAALERVLPLLSAVAEGRSCTMAAGDLRRDVAAVLALPHTGQPVEGDAHLSELWIAETRENGRLRAILSRLEKHCGTFTNNEISALCREALSSAPASPQPREGSQ